jgi:hypothetical protein
MFPYMEIMIQYEEEYTCSYNGYKTIIDMNKIPKWCPLQERGNKNV